MSEHAIKYTEERIDAFPTRIFRRHFSGLEAFNQRMAKIILAKEASGASQVVRSNVGGWHSENDLMRWDEPEIQILLSLLQSAMVDYVASETNRAPGTFELSVSMDAWANVVRAGNYAKPHVHPQTNFALVYYVDAGDHVAEGPLDMSGALEFLDPRNRPHLVASPAVDDRDCLLTRPQSSTLLVFPAWMYHYTHPYKGTRPRISIAVNAQVQGIKLLAEGPPRERPSARIIEEEG